MLQTVDLFSDEEVEALELEVTDQIATRNELIAKSKDTKGWVILYRTVVNNTFDDILLKYPHLDLNASWNENERDQLCRRIS